MQRRGVRLGEQGGCGVGMSPSHADPLPMRTLQADPLPMWTPSPATGWRAKRPGIEQRLTMEGRGCRREVPGLTLVLFSGQKKASSCLAVAMPRRAGGPAGESQHGLGGARRRGGLGAGAHSPRPAGEHVALSAPAPPPLWPAAAPSERTGANENNRAPPPPGRTRPEMAPRPIKE